MGLALFKERRLAERLMLTGTLPGRLLRSDGNGTVSCKPIDVSEHGLGIVIVGQKKKLADGTMLKLVTGEGEIDLKVAWSSPDFGKQDSTRYGLVTIDETINLEEVFRQYRCIR